MERDEAMAAATDHYRAQLGAQTGKPGALALLDEGLEALDAELDALSHRIGPILSQFASTEKVAGPRPEPSSQIAGRVERLGELRARLRDVIDRVEL